MFDNDKYTDRDLREMREIALDRAQLALAKKRSGDLTPSEGAELDALLAEVKDLTTEIDKREAAWPSQTRKGGYIQPGADGLTGTAYRAATGGGLLQPGEVRGLRPNERLTSCVPGAHNSEGLSLGRLLRGVLLNDWKGADLERRVMNETTPSAGGFLVPTPLSARVIDLARNVSALVRAGATTIPMESSTLKFGKVLTDPSASWKTENEALSPSDVTFDVVTLTAQMLMAACKLSLEVFEDAQNLDAIIENSLAGALALEMDRVGLVGSGTPPEPDGILALAGVETVAAGGALTDYSKLLEGVGKVLVNNTDLSKVAAIYAPRTWAELARLLDGNLNPMQAPSAWNEMLKIVSNQVPTNLGGGTESVVFLGDFSQVLIGTRTNITIEVSRVAADAETSAFLNGQVWIRAYMRGDIQVARPNQLCTVTGIVPPGD